VVYRWAEGGVYERREMWKDRGAPSHVSVWTKGT
jgi:hypothetical protein